MILESPGTSPGLFVFIAFEADEFEVSFTVVENNDLNIVFVFLLNLCLLFNNDKLNEQDIRI